MKVINHQKDNYSILNTFVMRGTIEMTRAEYEKVYKFLFKAYKKANEKYDTYIRDSLSSLKYEPTRQKFFSVGVCGTQLIFEKFNLPRYKRGQNYQIRITN